MSPTAGLQTKLIDGVDLPAGLDRIVPVSEVQKYIGLTNPRLGSIWLAANGDAWKSLPPDLQDLFERLTTNYIGHERVAAKTINAAMADKLTAQGLAFNKVDQAPFRKLLGSYYHSWAGRWEPRHGA